jgi:hypothetical protein
MTCGFVIPLSARVEQTHITTNGEKCMDGFWDFGLMDSQFSEIDIFAAVS